MGSINSLLLCGRLESGILIFLSLGFLTFFLLEKLVMRLGVVMACSLF